jgi:hypothetical protein
MANNDKPALPPLEDCLHNVAALDPLDGVTAFSRKSDIMFLGMPELDTLLQACADNVHVLRQQVFAPVLVASNGMMHRMRAKMQPKDAGYVNTCAVSSEQTPRYIF